MSGGGAPLLRLSGVDFAYDERMILSRVDLDLFDGERVALTGPNGAGKSTLLQVLVGLRRPRAGKVVAFGRLCRTESDFVAVRARVGLVFQNSDDQLFCPTVLDDVAFGPLNLGLSTDRARSTAQQTLAALGLCGFEPRVTNRLSAGEKRLVALASVLAMQPRVLLLDEPTDGLDEESEERLIGHLSGLRQAMLIVSHDRRLLGALAHRAVVLRDGRLREARLHRHPHLHRHEHLHLHLPGDGAEHPPEATEDGAPRHPDHHGADAP